MNKKLLTTALSSMILASAVAPLFAQKAGAASGTGLDALDEQRVMGELVDRGLQSLLKREFEANHTPQDQQNGVLARVAMNKLSDPNSHLSAKEREDLLNQVASGIVQALPSMTDPKMLMQNAKILVTVGLSPDINSLEYWGENKKKQDHAKPLIETVLKIYQKAEAEAQRLEDNIANHMTPSSSAKPWEDMDSLHTLAGFSENMAKYDQCLVLDKNDPQRKAIADDAIKNLQQFDTADSGVQAVVRNRIAKLNMAKGDYTQARKVFDSVIALPKVDKASEDEARYFSVMNDIEAGKLDDAQKDIDALATWEKTNLTDPAAQSGAAAALAILKYRILSTQSDAATAEADKKKLNDDAIAVLMQLVKDQPAYKANVFEQVMTRLPANADLSTLDPLLLLAIQQQGLDEFLKPESAAVDEKVIDRGAMAAREILKRKGQPGVDAQTAARSAYILPYLLEREKKTKEAASAFMDYAQQFPTNLTEANDALEHATALIAQLRKADIEDQDTRKLYDRFLPLAIQPPFNRKQFAFEYGLLLQREEHYKDAVEYFKKVTPEDKRYLSARFFEMVALKQRLNDDNDKMDATERGEVMSQIQTLADQVNKDAAAEASATTNDDKKRYSSMQVRTALLAADLANHEQKQPQRALDLLNGFEDRIKDLDDKQKQALMIEVLTLRVNAYMGIGKSDDATKALVQLIDLDKNAGPRMVFDLLQKLSTDMDHAKATGDTQQVKQIAQNRAVLTGFLVTWAEGNSDPKIKALAPKYRAADASTNLMAAELTDDPATKKQRLQDALKQYQALDDPKAPDPSIKLGIGEVQFDLGNYKEAMDTLSPLVLNNQLGSAYTTVMEDGEPKDVENTVFWEGVYKLLKATAEYAKQNPNDPAAQEQLANVKTDLKRRYVLFPKTIGGKKFHADFEKLRAEIIPDFNPDSLEAPASQPVANQ